MTPINLAILWPRAPVQHDSEVPHFIDGMIRSSMSILEMPHDSASNSAVKSSQIHWQHP